VVRLAHGHSLQALVINDGADDQFPRGTPVTAALPPDALRLLEPA
jgi:hypothetical protein